MILHSQITPERSQITQELPKIMHLGHSFFSGPRQIIFFFHCSLLKAGSHGSWRPVQSKNNTHHFFKPNCWKLQNYSKNVNLKIGSKGPQKLWPFFSLSFISKAYVSQQTKVGFDNNAGFLWCEAGSFLGHYVASNTEHPLALAPCHRMKWMRPLSV